jgi:Protein of unknown function (DUF3099)
VVQVHDGPVRRIRSDVPTVITNAPESAAREFEHRRRRYALMMASRAICIVIAALVYRVSGLLALAFVIGGGVLPWCAVIIANDRPPKKRRARIGVVTPPLDRSLPNGSRSNGHKPLGD